MSCLDGHTGPLMRCGAIERLGAAPLTLVPGPGAVHFQFESDTDSNHCMVTRTTDLGLPGDQVMHDHDGDPQQLRAHAVRQFAMAIDVREISPGYAEMLVAEAMDLQDRAIAIEEAANIRPSSDVPQPAQQQEQVQPKKEDE